MHPRMELVWCLLQNMPNGEESSVAFASRILSPAEQNYSQVEKEVLVCVFAIKKFHFCGFGQQFTLHAQEPQAIAHPLERTSLYLHKCLQRMALTLVVHISIPTDGNTLQC